MTTPQIRYYECLYRIDSLRRQQIQLAMECARAFEEADGAWRELDCESRNLADPEKPKPRTEGWTALEKYVEARVILRDFPKPHSRDHTPESSRQSQRRYWEKVRDDARVSLTSAELSLAEETLGYI